MVIIATPNGFALQCPDCYLLATNPGPVLEILLETTAFQISTQRENHDEILRIWRLHNVVEKSCRKIISVLIPEEYYRNLNNMYTQLSNVTTLTIITHLLIEHGKLSDQAIQDNDRLMKKEIMGETDFEDFVLQIERNF